jgi:hypothetical protein
MSDNPRQNWFQPAAALLAGATLIATIGYFMGIVTGGHDRFDRKQLQAIVDHARQLNIEPEKDVEMRIDEIENPKALRYLRPGESFRIGQGRGNVWIRVSKAGHLKCVIETSDQGHAGEYGFAFSDDPWVLREYEHDNNWHTVDVPGHQLFLTLPNMKIDQNWIAVENNQN